jgi:hypothetical protein
MIAAESKSAMRNEKELPATDFMRTPFENRCGSNQRG